MTTNANQAQAEKLALSISPDGQFERSDISFSWIGHHNNETTAIWANDSRISHGCITAELADELTTFLTKAENDSVTRIILCIDSAGIDLKQSWRAMKATAKLIKRLLHLRTKHAIATIAILGTEVGCYGGAYLLASSCQYVLGYPQGRSGVSGEKVIQHLNPSNNHLNSLFYSAPFRVMNKEVFALLPASMMQQRDLILTLQHQPLTQQSLMAEFKELEACYLEDQYAALTPACLPAQSPELSPTQSPSKTQTSKSTLGFQEATEIGCSELFGFIEQLLPYLTDHSGHKSALTLNKLPLIMGNCEQQFSFLNEQKGYSRYLGLCMKLLRYLSESGVRVRVKVNKRGNGAAFIALSLMADIIIIKEGSSIYPLPDKAITLLTHTNTLKGNEWCIP